MRNLWLEAFTICLLIVITQVSTEQVVCRNCEGYQICGFKTFQTPDCPNGFPCTKEEFTLCTEVTMARENGKCDRPGIFAEPTSPSKFYVCEIKEKSLSFVKKPITCPKNTSFDLSTMECLSENEKTVLKSAKELTVTYRNEHFSFYCKKTGTFPDPYDCKMYHVCNSKLESQDFYCPQGAYFNGTNCTTTDTEKCVQQFKKQFQDRVLQAKALFQNVKYRLTITSPTPQKFNSSASLISPGVIKRTFYDKNKTRYTYFGIKEGSNSSNYNNNNNNKAGLKNFEQFVENIIAQEEIEKNSSVILSELKSASKNIIGTYVRNTTLLTTESGRKLGKNKQNKPTNLKRTVTLNKVTIIFITQSNCKSCSCLTPAKPFVADNLNTNSPEEEFSNGKTYYLETHPTYQKDIRAYSLVKTTALDTQQLYGVTDLVLGIKGTNSTPHTYASKSPLAPQDIHTNFSSEFETGPTFTLTSAKEGSDLESVESTELKEIASSDEEFSTERTLNSGGEITLTKDSTIWHPPITSSEFKDESVGTQGTKVPHNLELGIETEPTIMYTTTSQYFSVDSSTQFKETTYADQGLSSTRSSRPRTASQSNKITTDKYSDADTVLRGQQMTSYNRELSISTESDLESASTAMKTGASLYVDHNATIQFIEISDRTKSDLKTESIISKTSSNSQLSVTNPTNQEFSNSKLSDIENQTAIMKTSGSEYSEETTFSASSNPSNSEKGSTITKTSSGHYPDSYPFLRAAKATFQHQEFLSSEVDDSETEATNTKTSAGQFSDTIHNLPTQFIETSDSTHSNLGTESTILKASANQTSDTETFYLTEQTSSVYEGFSKDMTSDSQTDFTFISTSTVNHSNAESAKRFSKSTSTNEGLSNSSPVQSEIPFEFIKTTFPQVQQITSHRQVLSSSAVSNSQIAPAIIKTGTLQFPKAESATESLKTTVNGELSIGTTFDSETASAFMKTNVSWNTTPLFSEMVSGDLRFFSSEDTGSEIKSTSLKSNTSQYSDTVSFTHSLETISDLFRVSESEQGKISTKELFYSVKEPYSGMKATKAANSISAKNYDETSPQSTEHISELQKPLSNTTAQSELGTTQLEIKTIEMLFSTETPYSGPNTSTPNIDQPPDSISSPKKEGLTSKSQNRDLELENALKTLSTVQVSEGSTYPNLKDTTPTVHSTKDSESATVSMSSSITQQHLDISSSVNSSTATFFAKNNYHSYALEPEWKINPAFSGTSTSPDTSTSDSMGTTVLTPTDTIQNLYVGFSTNSQNVTFLTQIIPRGTTLLSGTTEINNDKLSDIDPQITKLTSYNPNFRDITITKPEIGTIIMIENSQDIQNSAIPKAKEKFSTIQYPYSNWTQTSGTETIRAKTSTNIDSHTLSSPFVESTNSITEDLQSSKIVKLETETSGMSVSTPLFFDTSKGSHSEITASPTAEIYGSWAVKNAITETDFSQHPFINIFYSSETIPPEQNVFSSANLDSETDTSTKKITSSQLPNSNQYTYFEETIFTTPSTESDSVHASEQFNTVENINFDTSRFSKMTSSNQNAYADESSKTTENTHNENINNITTERETDKMKSITSTFPGPTAASSAIQRPHTSSTLESETITPSVQIGTNRRKDNTVIPQYVKSAPNQELSSNTSEAETVSTKPFSTGSLPQSCDSAFAIQNLDMNTIGETEKETTPVIASTMQVLQTSTKMESTPTSQGHNESYSEKSGKTPDLYGTSDMLLNTFSTVSQSIETTPSDQRKMSSTVIKLEAGNTLSKVSTTQYPHIIISPNDITVTIEDYQNSPNLESATADSTDTIKVSNGLYSEKHSSTQPIEITTSGKEYFGRKDSETDNLLIETSRREEANFIHTEKETFPNQEYPINTTLDSFSTGQFSYTDPFILSIKTTSEDYSSGGTLFSESGTTLKKTSTNQHPDKIAISDLEGTTFSNRGMNIPDSLPSEIENSVIETTAYQFFGPDSFTLFTKTTSADQKLSSSMPSDLETESVFIKTGTPKYSKIGSSEEIPLLIKELLNSTMSNSSSVNHISYTDSSTEYMKPNSADQAHSIRTGSDSEAGFTVMRTSTNQFTNTNSFNQFKEVPSEGQEFSGSKVSDSEMESTIMTTSTSQYFDDFATTQTTRGTNSDVEKESTFSKASTDKDSSTDSFIRSAGRSSSDGIISSSKDVEYEFESSSAAVEPETKSTVMSIKTSQHSVLVSSADFVEKAFSNALVPSSTSVQREEEFTSMKYTVRVSFDHSDEKISSDVLPSSSVPYDSESVITSQDSYVTKTTELEGTASIIQNVRNALTKDIEVKPSPTISGAIDYSNTGSSTRSKETPSSDVIYSKNAALESGEESTDHPNINTSSQFQDTASIIDIIRGTLKSETETIQTIVTLNQEPNIDILTESSGFEDSGNVALESGTEVILMQTKKKPLNNTISHSKQFQAVTNTPQQTPGYPTSQSEITYTKVSINQHSDADVIQKPTETIPAYQGSSSGTVFDLETGSTSAEYSSRVNASSQSRETSSSGVAFFSGTGLNSESEAILTKSSTNGQSYNTTSLELKNTYTTPIIRGSSGLELVPQTTITKESTNQYSDSSTTSTELISGKEITLIKANASQYSDTDSLAEFIKTISSDEVGFKSTDSNSEKEASVMKSSTSKYSNINSSTQEKETTSPSSIFLSSTDTERLFSKASKNRSSDIGFTIESKQMALTDEAFPSNVALEPEKKVTLMKATTSRNPHTSIVSEMEDTTLGNEDIHRDFILSGVDTTIKFQGTFSGTGSKLGTDTTITNLDNGQTQTGTSSQFVDTILYNQDMYTFSSLDTETKRTVAKVSTNQQPLTKTSSEIPKTTSATEDIHRGLNIVSENETTSTKISKSPHVKPCQSEGANSITRNVDFNTRVDSETGTTEIEIKTTKIVRELMSSPERKDLSSTYGSTTLDLDTEAIHTTSSPGQQAGINSYTSSTKMTSPNQEFYTVAAPDRETEKTHVKTSTEQQSAYDSSSQMIKVTSLGQGITSSTVLELGSDTSLEETSTILHPFISASPEVEVATSTIQNIQNGLSLEAETIYGEGSTNQYSDLDTLQSTVKISTKEDFSTNKASKPDVRLIKPSSSRIPSISTPSQPVEMITADPGFSTSKDMNSKAVSTSTKASISKFLVVSASPHLEYSTFTREETPGSPVSESGKENTLMKTNTRQYSDTDRLSTSTEIDLGDQFTPHSTQQPLFTATSQIPNSYSSTSAETETTAKEYLQTNIALSKITPEFQDLYSSTHEGNYLATSLTKKSTNLNLIHSLPEKTTQIQNVNIGMNVEPGISVAPKKSTASSTLVYSSTPLHSGRTVDVELMTIFPHSDISASTESLAASSQTQSLYNTKLLNSEIHIVLTKLSNTEHPDRSTTLHSDKTSITKASTTKHSDFNGWPYLKEISPPIQNIDNGTTGEPDTRTISTKFSSAEIFYTGTASPSTYDRNISTLLVSDRTITSEASLNSHTNTFHSINNISRTSEIHNTTASTPQLTSTSVVKKVSTSQNDSTSSFFHPKATTTTLTKTNTSFSPDYSKVTVFKKVTSPPQKMKIFLKKTDSIETILKSKTPQSGMTGTLTATPTQHPHISTFSYSKGIASQSQNIHNSASVESETVTLLKKVSTFQTQNINLESVTVSPNGISTAQNFNISGSNSSQIEPEIFSSTKTNITQHLNSNITENTSQAEETKGGIDFVKPTTINTSYKPFLEKITAPPSVIRKQHSNTSVTPPSTALIFSVQNHNNNETSHALSWDPSSSTLTTSPFATSTSTNTTTGSLSNTSTHFGTNKSTFYYSQSSIIPHSKETVFSPNQNKMTALEQNKTSFGGGIQISTTFRPRKNLRIDSKNNSRNKPKSYSKNNFKINIKKKRTGSFRCTTVGLFRDPNDCHSYYNCSYVNVKNKNCTFCEKSKWWKLVATHKTCEDGKWFSALLWRCVKIRPLLC